MTISRRSFFGIAAGAVAAAAAVPAAAAEVKTGFDLAAGPDMSVGYFRGMTAAQNEMMLARLRFEQLRYFYGVEGHRFGGLWEQIADKPVVHSPAVRAAIRAHDAKKKMTRKQFERSLLSPIGEGRLE